MRADERQAAVAYAYAWWMTGDDDAAATALREALASPDPPGSGNEARLVALTAGVRRALGDLRPMPPASELALLHDGFGVPLAAAAELALVVPEQAAARLADGRMEALLETVREDFRHGERLGGLAVGKPEDLAHAEDCRSCTRARVLIDRGAAELAQVSSVSAPPGLLARLVAEAAPAEAEVAVAVAEPADAAVETPAEATADADTGDDAIAVHDIIPGPGDYAAAGDDVLDAALPEPPEEIVLDDADVEVTIVDEGPAAVPDAVPPPVEAPEDIVIPDATALPKAPGRPAPTAPQVEPELEPETGRGPAVPTTPARRRAAGLLAGAGLITAGVLVAVLIASSGDEEPGPPPATEQPVVDGGEATEPPPDEAEPTDDPFGPPLEEGPGFSVTSAGLLLSGEDEIAPSGTRIGPQEPLRIAVAYEKASKGVELKALWRVGDEVFQRLETLVTSRSSQHVWGMPVPPDGWPAGKHRIVITADDTVAGAIDFTVRRPN